MATDRPLMLAVGGDSGTAKTTLSRGLTAFFGAVNVLHVCLDDYHLLDRAARQRAGITALNPAANDLRTMEEHVWAHLPHRRHLRPDDPGVFLQATPVTVR